MGNSTSAPAKSVVRFVLGTVGPSLIVIGISLWVWGNTSQPGGPGFYADPSSGWSVSSCSTGNSKDTVVVRPNSSANCTASDRRVPLVSVTWLTCCFGPVSTKGESPVSIAGVAAQPAGLGTSLYGNFEEFDLHYVVVHGQTYNVTVAMGSDTPGPPSPSYVAQQLAWWRWNPWAAQAGVVVLIVGLLFIGVAAHRVVVQVIGLGAVVGGLKLFAAAADTQSFSQNPLIDLLEILAVALILLGIAVSLYVLVVFVSRLPRIVKRTHE
jgi:hypothetical protein